MLLLFQTIGEEKEKLMLEHTFVRPGVIARLRQSPFLYRTLLQRFLK